MADFKRRKRFNTRAPQIEVAGSLARGRHVFQLVVEDADGNKSQAAKVVVKIV